jgi:hypothetical protein
MLPWNLEDWLTEQGDRVVKLAETAGHGSLSPVDRLVYEVWLIDTEQRNGGLAQYFGNRGREHWERLRALALPALPSFALFADLVESTIHGSTDPYEAVIDADTDLDAAYDACKSRLVTELKSLVDPD